MVIPAAGWWGSASSESMGERNANCAAHRMHSAGARLVMNPPGGWYRATGAAPPGPPARRRPASPHSTAITWAQTAIMPMNRANEAKTVTSSMTARIIGPLPAGMRTYGELCSLFVLVSSAMALPFPQNGNCYIFSAERKPTMARPRPKPAAVIVHERVALTKATVRAAEKLDLSNRLLAAVIGVSEPSVSRMKKGEFQLERGQKPFELGVLFVRLYRSLDAIVSGDEA